MAGIQRKTADVHAKAFRAGVETLPIGGAYKFRRKGETHAWGATLLHQMQKACDTGSYEAFKVYWRGCWPSRRSTSATSRTSPLREPVPIEEVESITSIRKRFVTPACRSARSAPRRTRR